MTQYINRGSVNNLIFSLDNITMPYFLFEFKNIHSGLIKYCILQSQSSYPDRYYKFLFTESNTDDAVNGILKLDDKGQYDVRIFNQSSSTNLNPNNATLIRSDEMIIVRWNQPVIRTYTATRSQNIIYKNGAI